MSKALRVIRDEHRALAAALQALRYRVRRIREGHPCEDFEVFHAILHYIEQFPEKSHHPKEDRYLFRKVRLRTREADSVLAELEREHRTGAELIRKLEQALVRWRQGGEAEFVAFADQVDAYIEFHWRHMSKEEQVVLPLAERVLIQADWAEIDAAFEANADPLIGQDVKQGFDELLERIVGDYVEYVHQIERMDRYEPSDHSNISAVRVTDEARQKTPPVRRS